MSHLHRVVELLAPGTRCDVGIRRGHAMRKPIRPSIALIAMEYGLLGACFGLWLVIALDEIGVLA